MMKWISLIVAGLLLMTSPVGAAAKGKIGIIDFRALMESSDAGDSAKTEIKEKGESLKAELIKAQDDLKKMQETYKRESVLWTDDQKKEKQKSFQIELNELKKLQLEKTKEFNAFRAELFNDLKEKLTKYLEKKGKREGYALIIEKRSGEVLFANPDMDITQDIVKDYDKIVKE